MERALCLDRYKPTKKKILSRRTYQRQPQQVDRSANNTVSIPLRSIQIRSAQRMQPAQWSHADHILLLAPPAIMKLADSFFDPRAAASIDDDPPANSIQHMRMPAPPLHRNLMVQQCDRADRGM